METEDLIAIGALIVSAISVTISLLQSRRAAWDLMIKALQGEKESVGYVAYQLAIHGLPSGRAYSSDLLTSLCLAGVFEGSDRSRALAYGALKKLSSRHRDEISERLDFIEKVFGDFGGLLRLKRGRRRLERLRVALDLKGNGMTEAQAPQNTLSSGSC